MDYLQTNGIRGPPVENPLVWEYEGSIGNVSSYCRNHQHFSPLFDRPSFRATPFTLFKPLQLLLLASSTIFTLYIWAQLNFTNIFFHHILVTFDLAISVLVLGWDKVAPGYPMLGGAPGRYRAGAIDFFR